jgi:hypothetical protein
VAWRIGSYTQKEVVNAELSNLAFDLFYWFSRFEFALKANGYLKSHADDAKAEPGWRQFEETWRDKYTASTEAAWLLSHAPKAQKVGPGDSLIWGSVGLADCTSPLSAVTRLVKTVRNNLFHGGKHGAGNWDDPKRSTELLLVSLAITSQFASLANIEADYLQRY